MAWVRIHDGAMTHPKVVGMFDWRDPFHLWVWGLSYCQTHLTDGRIVREAVPKAGNKAAAELVKRSLWDVCEDGGWVVHDYLTYNDSREHALNERRKARERMANNRRTSREVPSYVSVPSRAVVEKGSGEKPNTETEDFLRFWNAYPRQEGLKAAADVWGLLDPGPDLVETILRAVERQKQLPQWSDYQFIPSPRRYLEEARWQDILPPVSKALWTSAECPHGEKCGSAHICDIKSKLDAARAERAARRPA